MSLEAWCDKRLAATRRSHRSNDHCVNNCPKRMLIILAIIPAVTVD